MYQERTTERHPLGLERLSGGTRGLYYANEQVEVVTNPETGQESQQYLYDVYEIEDCTRKAKRKNGIISDAHPFGDEQKVLRKAIAMLVAKANLQDDPDFAEFMAYHRFVESI
jgi:hypothetical protein